MPKHSFKGGVHPLHDQHEGKTSTTGLPIRAYVPDSVDIPMSMSIGAPATPIVQVGDHVKMGQKIGEANGFVSLPVHASVSGEVTAIGTKVLLLGGPTTIVTIKNDFQDEWTELSPLGPVEEADPAKIVPAVQAAGICGMGGAGRSALRCACFSWVRCWATGPIIPRSPRRAGVPSPVWWPRSFACGRTDRCRPSSGM